MTELLKEDAKEGQNKHQKELFTRRHFTRQKRYPSCFQHVRDYFISLQGYETAITITKEQQESLNKAIENRDLKTLDGVLDKLSTFSAKINRILWLSKQNYWTWFKAWSNLLTIQIVQDAVESQLGKLPDAIIENIKPTLKEKLESIAKEPRNFLPHWVLSEPIVIEAQYLKAIATQKKELWVDGNGLNSKSLRILLDFDRKREEQDCTNSENNQQKFNQSLAEQISELAKSHAENLGVIKNLTDKLLSNTTDKKQHLKKNWGLLSVILSKLNVMTEPREDLRKRLLNYCNEAKKKSSHFVFDKNIFKCDYQIIVEMIKELCNTSPDDQSLFKCIANNMCEATPSLSDRLAPLNHGKNKLSLLVKPSAQEDTEIVKPEICKKYAEKSKIIDDLILKDKSITAYLGNAADNKQKKVELLDNYTSWKAGFYGAENDDELFLLYILAQKNNILAKGPDKPIDEAFEKLGIETFFHKGMIANEEMIGEAKKYLESSNTNRSLENLNSTLKELRNNLYTSLELNTWVQPICQKALFLIENEMNRLKSDPEYKDYKEKNSICRIRVKLLTQLYQEAKAAIGETLKEICEKSPCKEKMSAQEKNPVLNEARDKLFDSLATSIEEYKKEDCINKHRNTIGALLKKIVYTILLAIFGERIPFITSDTLKNGCNHLTNSAAMFKNCKDALVDLQENAQSPEKVSSDNEQNEASEPSCIDGLICWALPPTR